ncbi:hypothetical protein PAXRUDRAFT_830015 [Paxillus rubicundulus Ve08.2h10]|uniref:Uncharacterized protein n=1 Tax=Paxillus rubicundulus Ve08.2h10 TaxID=930991 RepID=A0A0D0DLT8_9AGAM|nr:hypothetical protein PAXRUDRAFT_830015 [Paxillus rubicundulus Ve08.2h10]
MSPSAASPSHTTHNSLPPFAADDPHDAPAKISAYYSLVFPNITFYLQTLTVTIGRRCIPPASNSVTGADGVTSTQSPVDVDLGPLKSVSRLHAKIEYEEEEERFVLVVIGRNGAWVDGVWSGASSRVPLGERSQIQIASRTFHFVLPPPPAPEDSPSPSSNSSVQRARSPSVDITSLSPPSSLPSHSPPPRPAPSLPPPKVACSPEPQLPNSNAISRTKNASASTPPSTSTASTSKKRKKLSQPPPKPEVMPPKPQLTYAQLCYRAIKAMGGKATLQDICGWMIDNYDWYRYNEGAGWENSVRHNLSSGRAFKKMERSTGEHGKGFFWSLDEQYEHTFEEQEARALAQAQSPSQAALQQAGSKDGTGKGSRKKDKVIPLEPPLKRSVKSGTGPLPPPLTSTPLAIPLKSPSGTGSLMPGQPVGGLAQVMAMGGAFTTVPRDIVRGSVSGGTARQLLQAEPDRIGSVVARDMPTANGPTTSPALISAMVSADNSSSGATGVSASETTSSSVTQSTCTHPASLAPASPLAALPPSVCLPIVVGPVPSSHPSSTTPDPPPIVLHNNSLVLSPVIFSSLAPEQLKALEKMGAQKALEVLQGHIVRYLKERMGRKKRKKAVASVGGEKGGTKNGRGDVQERSSPFTSAPLPPRTLLQPQPSTSQQSIAPHPLSQPPTTVTVSSTLLDFSSGRTECPTPNPAEVKESVPSFVDNRPPVPVPITRNDPTPAERPQSPIIVVDDVDSEDGRPAKKRKIGHDVEDIGAEGKMDLGVAQVADSVDEDIEIDVC